MDGWKLTSETWMRWAIRGVASTLHELLEMLTRPALTGNCKPLSLMHLFLTHRFLHYLPGKIIKSPLITENGWGFVQVFHFNIQSHSSFFSVLMHNYVSPPSLCSRLPSPCPFPSISTSTPLSISAFAQPFLFSDLPFLSLFLSLPQSLCPQALTADCVM